MKFSFVSLKILFSGLLLSLVSYSSLSVAETVEDGLSAFKQSNFEQAHEIWKPLAEAGDVRANYFMSQLYAKGKGVNKQERLAMEHLAVAARGGHATAQFNLGNHYNQGRWVEENPRMAAYWWRKAGSQAMPRAQHNLASLYLLGRGVDKDIEKARHWYRRAAGNGIERAKKALADLDAPQGKAPQALVKKPEPVVVKPKLVEKPKAADKPALVSKPKASSSAKVTFAALDQGWLKRQSGNLYTLQLFATESRKTIDKLLSTHNLKRQVAVYRFRSKSRDFYGVSYGRFETVEMARTAIAELPKALSDNKPWPRRFSDIQALLVK